MIEHIFVFSPLAQPSASQAPYHGRIFLKIACEVLRRKNLPVLCYSDLQEVTGSIRHSAGE
jgi:hypothetical protein